MKKNLRNRVLAAILTGTMGLPLAACDEAAIRKEAEEEESKVINTIDENNQKNLEELYKKIEILLEDKDNASKDDLEHLLDEIKKAQATTTYTTELTQTTTVTEPTVLTTNSTSTTVTSTNQTTVTSTTTASTNQTTTGTTQTTALPAYNNEPTFEEKDASYVMANRYIISNEYTVKGENEGEGLYLYSIIRKLNNGEFKPEIEEEIKSLNKDLKGNFVAEGTKLTVPFTLVYCKGISAKDVSAYSDVSLDEIKKLNSISDSKEEVNYQDGLLIKSLKKDEKAYETENGEIQHIIGNAVVKGDAVYESSKTYKEGAVTSVLCITSKSKNQNVVEYIEIKEDGFCSGCILAENVKYVTFSNGYPVIVCNNENDMYLNGIEENIHPESFRTKINKQNFTNEYYMYESADKTVAVALSNINIPEFKYYGTIGGKQKTK